MRTKKPKATKTATPPGHKPLLPIDLRGVISTTRLLEAVHRRKLQLHLTHTDGYFTAVVGGCTGKPRQNAEAALTTAIIAWNRSDRLPPPVPTADALKASAQALDQRLTDLRAAIATLEHDHNAAASATAATPASTGLARTSAEVYIVSRREDGESSDIEAVCSSQELADAAANDAAETCGYADWEKWTVDGVYLERSPKIRKP